MTTSADWQAMVREEALFFGGICATVSHEINNRLAVINENAGLLEDLAMILAEGKTIDPGRIQAQSRKILEQVRTARHVVRNLNRFAHSVDTWSCTIDVADVLDLVTQLYARKAANASATLETSGSSQPVTISTVPFFLENLIGRGIDMALSRIGDAGVVTIGAEASPEGIRVRFEGLAGLTDPMGLLDADQGSRALLAWLGARYRSEPDGTALLLEIPDREPHTQGGTP